LGWGAVEKIKLQRSALLSKSLGTTDLLTEMQYDIHFVSGVKYVVA